MKKVSYLLKIPACCLACPKGLFLAEIRILKNYIYLLISSHKITNFWSCADKVGWKGHFESFQLNCSSTKNSHFGTVSPLQYSAKIWWGPVTPSYIAEIYHQICQIYLFSGLKTHYVRKISLSHTSVMPLHAVSSYKNHSYDQH